MSKTKKVTKKVTRKKFTTANRKSSSRNVSQKTTARSRKKTDSFSDRDIKDGYRKITKSTEIFLKKISYGGRAVIDYFKKILQKDEIVPVTSFGFGAGVAMRSDHFIAVAVPDRYGVPEIITARVGRDSIQDMPIMKYPLVRGVGMLVENVSILAFLGSHIRNIHKKDKRQNILNSREKRLYYFGRSAVLLFLAVIFLQYLFNQIQIASVTGFVPDFGFFIGMIVSILIFTILFGLIFSIPSGTIEMLAYQRASHAILSMYLSGEKMTIEKITKLEKQYDRPAIPLLFWTIFFFSLLLTVMNLYAMSLVMAILIMTGVFVLAYALAYELVHFSLKDQKGLFFHFFITPFIAIQNVIFIFPEKRHIYMGVAALEEVVRLEKQYLRS